jgi:hypothetical protein
MFNKNNEEFLYNLSKSESPSDVFGAWGSSKNNTKDMCGIIALPNYEKSAYPTDLYDLVNSDDSCVTPYFETDKLYFIEDKLLEEMFTNKPYRVNFSIDYSIMFDTNFSSYIHKFVSGLAITGTRNNIYIAIDLLIRKEFQFDYIFYMIENYYNHFHNSVDDQNTKQENQTKIHNNIVSLELFKSIDKEEYCSSGKLKYNISKHEASLNADQLFNDFYISDMGRKVLNQYITLHDCIVLFLIGVLRIRFQSSKSPHNKLAELFDYVDNVVGVYLDRETIVAHKFFENPKSVHILSNLNKGMKREKLYKSINNIAWDFTVPRIMEHLIQIGGEGRFFIPFFLSNDQNLRKLLRLYKVKGVLFNKNAEGLVPLTEETNLEYYQRNGCRVDYDMFFSVERVKRRKLRHQDNKEFKFSIINDEFNKLANVLECT